ncbi:MAG: hemin-degrading factor [Pseudomonas sp.]|nr:hemin-degrading factor [Pseudomonas sp.]
MKTIAMNQSSVSRFDAAQGRDLYLAWQVLRGAQPQLRARNAANELSVSEAELVACRVGEDAVLLRPDWQELLPDLLALGEVMVLTRNEHCVHERHGYYRETTVMANGKMGLVVSSDIDLRLFLSGWKSAFALCDETKGGIQRSLQFFDGQGVAVHKVYLTDNSDIAAWEALVARFTAVEQSNALVIEAAIQKPVELPDAEIDAVAMRERWASLKDTHHFFSLLKKAQVTRTQGLRLAGREWAEPLAIEALPQLFEQAAEQQLPIMVFVGNDHCVQIHSGTVTNLRWVGDWFNVLDPEFNLHLKANAIAQLWRVRKPTTDGVITSWEAYDAEGNLVVQLYGVRKPGVPECAKWRELAEHCSALPLLEA